MPNPELQAITQNPHCRPHTRAPSDIPVAFVGAVARCFDAHLPLEITPDAIWLTLSQGLALHVNQDAEKYREVFVSHKDKEKIKIRRDDFRRVRRAVHQSSSATVVVVEDGRRPGGRCFLSFCARVVGRPDDELGVVF